MRRLVAVKILPADKYDDPQTWKGSCERLGGRRAEPREHRSRLRYRQGRRHSFSRHGVCGRFEPSGNRGPVWPFEPNRAAYCIAQAAIGLQHAMEKGLIHRDVKPGNLLLDRTGVVKLLDLGLARFFEPEHDDKLTERFDEKCVLGTADYLAPEQALSNTVDSRADIYGLGGTFYFLLTGRSPVPEGNVTQKLLFHQKEEPTPVTQFRKDVPQGMLDVLLKMQKKNPDDRYQTPIEVAQALAEWAEKHQTVPPDYEMPDLCPAVVSLTGHSMERPRPSGVVSGSSVIRFVVPRTKVPASARTSSQVLHPSEAGSSTVEFRSKNTDQGSTLPLRHEQSPTQPITASSEMRARNGSAPHHDDTPTPIDSSENGNFQKGIQTDSSSSPGINPEAEPKSLFFLKVLLAFLIMSLIVLGAISYFR
ncbi:MAG: serine/threonine-protein kinase [Gemmataceae bacterium]